MSWIDPPLWRNLAEFKSCHTKPDNGMKRVAELRPVELPHDAASRCLQARTPFDMVAKGIGLSKNRGDRTPIELFRSEIGLWSLATRILVFSERVCTFTKLHLPWHAVHRACRGHAHSHVRWTSRRSGGPTTAESNAGFRPSSFNPARKENDHGKHAHPTVPVLRRPL